VLANIAYVAPLAAVAFYVIGKVVGNRVPLEDEVNGLDLPEMGVLGYSSDGGPMPTAPGIPGASGAPATVRVPAPSV